MTPASEARIRAAVAELADSIIAGLDSDPAPKGDRLLSIADAATALGIGRSRLYDEIAAGRIRSIHVGRRRLVPAAAVAEYIDRAAA
jgi:excisionase family DNA binding protein